MKELLLYMAKNLVDDPEAVTVTETSDEEGTVLELRVAPGDMGKVIGRQGRIAKEIRTIVKTVAQRTGEKVTVEIVDQWIVRDGQRHAFSFSPKQGEFYGSNLAGNVCGCKKPCRTTVRSRIMFWQVVSLLPSFPIAEGSTQVYVLTPVLRWASARSAMLFFI